MSISKNLPDQLAVVIRVLNHQQLLTHTNDVELARLAGLSRKTIGQYAKRWSLTPLAHQVVSASVTHLLNFIGNYQSSHSQVTHFTDHIPLLICSGISVTSHKQPPVPEACHMLVSLNMLGQLSMGSLLLLLNQADFSPYDRYLAVSLANLAQTNHHIGRSYNVISSLKSDERKALGFINYDMSSAIQIICFGLLYRYSADPELFSRFNLIFQYDFEVKVSH